MGRVAARTEMPANVKHRGSVMEKVMWGMLRSANKAVWMALVTMGATFCAQAQTYTRTDTITYSDNYILWVLGQEASSTNEDTGIVESKTTYNTATALPEKMYGPGTVALPGKLQQWLTYNSDGTVATAKDGNGNIITLSSWKRGIPQSIKYPATPEAPAGAVESAVVNNMGLIDSVTDENGYKTCYTYDAMGRVATITYPSETVVGACDNSAWNITSQTFVPYATGAEYGIPAGHWKQIVSTGNARKVTYFDALWRPLVTDTYDNANIASTRSISVEAYDLNGHPAFQSYALSTLSNYGAVVQGTRTTYDALDRVIQVEQDSELDAALGRPLITTTEYLDGFQTRVTNPRGYQTLTPMYQAYDQPTYAWPRGINEPEGKFTEIYRDVFGKPTAVRRRNGDGNQSAWRYYVYRPDYQTLCKTIDPETGVTVMDFDGAGNLGWSASGLSLTDAGNCNLEEAWTSGRLVGRTYDARNRLTTLAFPDGQGDQQWTYTADGLPSQITTWNDASSPTAINAYHYNKRRMLDGQDINQTSWYTWSAGYGYDGNGNLAVQTYPTGLTVAYAPNALGQATQAGSFATGVSYYPNGSVAQFTYGNGIVHTMQQNARQLPMRSRDVDGGSAVLDDSYDFDTNGNVAAISDGLAGARGNRTMTYDGLDRLADTASPMYGTTGTHYTYDVLDNLKTVRAPGRNQTYLYDAANRLTNVTNTGDGASVIGLGYDVQGNVANKNGQTTLFDYGNRLRQVNYAGSMVDRYRYDGYGRRISTIKPDGAFSLWLYSPAGQLMFSSTGPSNETTHEYVYLAGSLVATVEHAWPSNAITATRYQHTDALGSPVAVTSETGSVTERSEYEPYGLLLNRALHDGPGYTGHVNDAATGLSYMQQRYYDPGIGRFLSVDPVTADSNSGGNFNRYKYGANNPYRFTDPDGRRDWDSISAHISSLTGASVGFRIRAEVSSPGPVGSVHSGQGRLPATASVRTEMKSQKTTLTVNGTNAGEWPSKNDVSKRALPGADGPYESNDTYPTGGPYKNNAKAFGPNDILKTNDARGRWLHGGGTGLPDPSAPEQGWKPTLGCTRMQNNDIQELVNRVRDFKEIFPGASVPYSRVDK
jgi:RHS repeat-associated protein